MKLFLMLSLFGIVALAQKDQSQQKKPNILFIFADDQTYNTLSALEGCPVKTPNLDRLAEQGVRFSHTFNMGSFTPAVCVASRSMLITGSFLWQAAAYSDKGTPHSDSNAPKIQQNYTITKKEPEAYWPEYLKQAGYETYMAY